MKERKIATAEILGAVHTHTHTHTHTGSFRGCLACKKIIRKNKNIKAYELYTFVCAIAQARE